jgi:hypothetical protein
LGPGAKTCSPRTSPLRARAICCNEISTTPHFLEVKKPAAGTAGLFVRTGSRRSCRSAVHFSDRQTSSLSPL